MVKDRYRPIDVLTGQLELVLDNIVSRLTRVLDSDVCDTAAGILGRIGPRAADAVPALERLLNVRSDIVPWTEVLENALLALDAEDREESSLWSPTTRELATAIGRIAGPSESVLDALLSCTLRRDSCDDVADTIAELGLAEKAAEKLQTYFRHSEAHVRANAAYALEWIVPKLNEKQKGHITQGCLALVSDPDAEVRYYAFRTLGTTSCTPRVLIALTDALQSEYFADRKGALMALHDLGPETPDVIPLIIRQFDVKGDRTEELRAWAAHCLGRIGSLRPDTVLEPLKSALEDTHESVVAAAIEAISKIELPADTVLPLILAARRRFGSNNWAADAFNKSIDRIGLSPQWLRELIEMACEGQPDTPSNEDPPDLDFSEAFPTSPEDPDGLIGVLRDGLRDERRCVRRLSAAGVGCLARHAAAAVPALTDLLGDDTDVREEAIHALAEISTEQALRILGSLLGGENRGLQLTVAEALRSRPHDERLRQLSKSAQLAEIVPALIRVVETAEDWCLREAALEALSQRDYFEAQERLSSTFANAIEDDHADVRSAAIRGLGWVGDEDEAVAILREAMGNCTMYSPIAEPVLRAIDTVVKRNVPTLVRLLDQDYPLGHDDFDFREDVAISLSFAGQFMLKVLPAMTANEDRRLAAYSDAVLLAVHRAVDWMTQAMLDERESRVSRHNMMVVDLMSMATAICGFLDNSQEAKST